MSEPRTFTDGGHLDDYAAVVRELEAMHGQVIRIHARLTELDVRSGAVGAAKNLGQKIRSAIDFIATNGGVPWDENERLACNAWRVSAAATSPDGVLPHQKEWLALGDDVRERWRAAAAEFRA